MIENDNPNNLDSTNSASSNLSPIEPILPPTNPPNNLAVGEENNANSSLSSSSDSDFEKTLKSLKTLKKSPESENPADNLDLSSDLSSDPCETVDDCATLSNRPNRTSNSPARPKAESPVFSEEEEEDLANEPNESSDSQLYFSRKRRKNEFLSVNSGGTGELNGKSQKNPKIGENWKNGSKGEENAAEKNEFALQKAFNSGSFEYQTDRRFLVWNLIGSVTSYKILDSFTIDVEFSDISQYKPEKFDHRREFSAAALSEFGVVLITQPRGTEKNFVLFKPFKALSDEWTFFAPESSHFTALAIGKNYVVVGTDKNTIRVISLNGVQKSVFSVPGSILTITAKDDLFAIFYHAGSALKAPQIRCKIKNFTKNETINDKLVPMNPGVNLRWTGFNDFNMLIVIDAELNVSSLCRSAHFEWVPFANIRADLRKNDTFWPIGCFIDKIVGVVTEKAKGEVFVNGPNVTPKPILSPVSLKIELLKSEEKEDDGDISIEMFKAEKEAVLNELLFEEWKLSQSDALSGSKFSLRAKEYRAAIDKNLYLLFYYCASAWPLKALEYCERINTLTALKMCFKWAQDANMEKIHIGRLAEMIKAKFGEDVGCEGK